MPDNLPMQLTPEQAAARLRALAPALQTLLHDVPEEVWRWHPAAGEWCINQIIGHVIAADANGFVGRIRLILSQERPELPLWDIGGMVEQRQDCRRDPQDLLSELATAREEAARLVEQLKPEELRRSGIHPVVGELRVADLLHEWLHHEANHMKQILSNIQAWVWPFMGNSQRFSDPDFLRQLMERSRSS
ncbi:MAG: DinB family protein [Caldilineae bacterium]|nr:MAG: DinB family protein [Caldilineae bacterium]